MDKREHGNSVKQWERNAVSMLPGLLKEIAQATDYSTAMAIAREKGGRRASIALHPSPKGWLSRLVGIEKALAIGKALNGGLGGMDYLIPMGPGLLMRRKSEVLRMSLEGASKSDMARELGVHVRTIQIYRMRLRDEGVIFPVDMRKSGGKHG